MNEFSIYNFLNYKAYVKAWIRALPKRGHGEKRRIAEKIQCHSGYVSQVLEGSAHLSLEQAAALSDYLGHNSIEARFFLLLVQKGKAGTRLLENHFDSQINEIIERRISMQHRLEYKEKLSADDQATYYSSWQYAAIHVAISIPAFQTKDALSKHFQIRFKKVSEILDFLVEKGLVIEASGKYQHGPTKIYLPDTSPLISKHHSNWRVRALASFDQTLPHDTHYSSVATINEGDLPKVRAIFMKAIEEARALIGRSTNENKVFSYSLDLFTL
jgi:uncharacterized protein (TIGR02147 family)